MSIRTEVERIAPKLSGYSKSSLPYTFHHVYIRSCLIKYDSHADVAQAFRDADDDQLYSIAFLYLMSISNGIEIVENFTSDDIASARDIVFQAKRILEMLN